MIIGALLMFGAITISELAKADTAVIDRRVPIRTTYLPANEAVVVKTPDGNI